MSSIDQNVCFEVAYAAVSSRLCLFTGTGFSKAITENKAFGWQELLKEICRSSKELKPLQGVLFPTSGKNPLSLEESAQVIAIELSKLKKDIYEEIANKVSKIPLSGENTVISDFFKHHSLIVVTTNYDKLVEALVGDDKVQAITPGMPVPRSEARIIVYHIHGSIDSPQNMIVTSDDYFKFINSQSYFSKKLSTVLHENSVVILGYSLGDTNLKAILSEYKAFSRHHIIGGNLFFVSRNKVDQHVKDYYSYCYGIRVLDQLEIHDFFKEINAKMEEASKCGDSSKIDIKKVLYKGYVYKDEFLKIESSFFQIMASLAAIGASVKDPDVAKLLENILKKKIEFTSTSGAWEQYEHLARWLIHLGSIYELSKSRLESTFLDSVLLSMKKMSKDLLLGFSWSAYRLWSERWSDLIAANRVIIKAYIESKTTDSDALEIVRRG